MLVEVAKPVTLFLCILSLYAVFTTALLDPASDLEQRIYDSLARLILSAVISLMSGLIFCSASHEAARNTARLTSHSSRTDVLVGCRRHGGRFRPFLVSGAPLHFLPRYTLLICSRFNKELSRELELATAGSDES